MPVIDRASKPLRIRWSRTDKLTALGIVVAIVVGVVTILLTGGDKPAPASVSSVANGVTNSTNPTINNPICAQYCGGQTIGTQQALAAEPVNDGSKGCSMDPHDPSVDVGWGPARNILPKDKFSDFPAFNIDNVGPVGDERDFYNIREDGTPPPNIWHSTLKLERGKTYIFRMYIHNGAPDNMPATGTRAMVNLPNCTGRRIGSNGFIVAENANPKQIWGGVNMYADEPFNLNLIAGSILLCNNFYTCIPGRDNGATLSEDLFTSHGQLIGYDALDGKFPGNFKYSAYLTFKVRAQFAGDKP